MPRTDRGSCEKSFASALIRKVVYLQALTAGSSKLVRDEVERLASGRSGSKAESGRHLALDEHGHETANVGTAKSANALGNHASQVCGVDVGKDEPQSRHHLGYDHVVGDFIHCWSVAAAGGLGWALARSHRHTQTGAVLHTRVSTAMA